MRRTDLIVLYVVVLLHLNFRKKPINESANVFFFNFGWIISPTCRSFPPLNILFIVV